ncbi:helix-turn-helix transcriptional regulator [Fulvimarina sp. 2208YS6-2-32]|uniref:Helix-turn-helix transcriptional regulator n=1 Tax=Fulvimarina uroteuthidis TaxID=3098149 RepID=A0ABU5I3B4_9HYPH|nr:helix-turn-helix transcriptional regulator [Fulvimarina sp. 2208YS6-2-32]MDY8109458.1 helix-turn-helix transcriptional regulator [Fulvimarina sp. 2208YS6-2-32]
MNEAVTLNGDAMVVMTRAEYDAMIEDIGDSAIASYARSQSDERAPGMNAEYAREVWNGTLHPLAAWRKSVGWTQAELAAKAGIRAASVSDIEARKIDPRLSTLKALAGALKLGIEDITD